MGSTCLRYLGSGMPAGTIQSVKTLFASVDGRFSMGYDFLRCTAVASSHVVFSRPTLKGQSVTHFAADLQSGSGYTNEYFRIPSAESVSDNFCDFLLDVIVARLKRQSLEQSLGGSPFRLQSYLNSSVNLLVYTEAIQNDLSSANSRDRTISVSTKA